MCRPEEILLSASLPVASVVPLLISSNQMIAFGSLVTVSAGVAGRAVVERVGLDAADLVGVDKLAGVHGPRVCDGDVATVRPRIGDIE